MEPLDISLMEVCEKIHSEDGQDHIVVEWLSFLVQHYMYLTSVAIPSQSTS